ncbi:hypothetical protein MRB53_027875 [Persea americana]|uniref:Uncharacterized protein n=1 Tax=Persea americana TaxID=3435 RepID=A0ACC2KE13_PERAE|nr:hypothetical protein MRB53_027875 [Persea americana]
MVIANTLVKASPLSPLPADKWQPPTPPSLKIKIDGSYHHQTKTSSIGGIVRDHNGVLIKAFVVATAADFALEAEIKAMLRGSNLCIQLEAQEVIFEGDSFLVWNNLTTDSGMPWKVIHLWKKLQESFLLIPCWHVTLIRHETNRITDALAKLKPP